MNLPDRSAIVNDVELYKEDIARIFNSIQYESDKTTSAIECSIQCTFPEGSFATGSLDAFFENADTPKVLDSILIDVEMRNQETRNVSVYASSDGVYIRVEGGGESWNRGLFTLLVESVKSAQRPSVVINKPQWSWRVFGFLFFVELLASVSGIGSFSRTGNPVVAIIGVGGGIIIGFLAYLSYKWNKEYTPIRMRPRPCTISIACQPSPAPSSIKSNILNPMLDVGLGTVGAITACISAVVAISAVFLKLP
jgi:hypothetical protein